MAVVSANAASFSSFILLLLRIFSSWWWNLRFRCRGDQRLTTFQP
jgi:hypothetical protein